MPAYARPPRVIEREKLDFLAGLYDLAAHSLDPLSEKVPRQKINFTAKWRDCSMTCLTQSRN